MTLSPSSLISSTKDEAMGETTTTTTTTSSSFPIGREGHNDVDKTQRDGTTEETTTTTSRAAVEAEEAKELEEEGGRGTNGSVGDGNNREGAEAEAGAEEGMRDGDDRSNNDDDDGSDEHNDNPTKKKNNEEDEKVDDDPNDDDEEGEEEEDASMMPPFKFARVCGSSLPRRSYLHKRRQEQRQEQGQEVRKQLATTLPGPYDVKCTSSSFATTTSSSKHRHSHLLALGYADGSIRVIHPLTGMDVLGPSSSRLHVGGTTTTTSGGGGGGSGGGSGSASTTFEQRQRSGAGGGVGTIPPSMLDAITGLSFDADGCSLGGCQRNGNVCVWEWKYDEHQRGSGTGSGNGGSQYNVSSNKSVATIGGGGPRGGGGGGGMTRMPSSGNSVVSEPGGGGGTSSFWGGWGGGSSRSVVGAAATPTSSSSSGGGAGPVRPSPTATSSGNEESAAAASDDIPQQQLTPEQERAREVLTQIQPSTGPAPPNEVLRFSYPLSSVPTCLAIDPAFSRRGNDKRIVVGFADGRVILTRKAGGFWGGLGMMGRKSDTVLYQGTGVAPVKSSRSNNNNGDRKKRNAILGGIEALSWRGNLLAWADAGGVKLLNIETEERLAQIERPSGAKSTLYHPSIGQLRCHMCWETPSKFLVAWGDCLMELSIREQQQQQQGGQQQARTTTGPMGTAMGGTTTDDGSATAGLMLAGALGMAPPPPPPPGAAADGAVTKIGSSAAVVPPAPTRTTVECTMAWQLDCVACGVSPLDSKHVAVLGVLPPPFDEEEEEDGGVDSEGKKEQSGGLGGGGDDDDDDAGVATSSSSFPMTELQVISRRDGEIVSSDGLPLLFPEDNSITSDGGADKVSRAGDGTAEGLKKKRAMPPSLLPHPSAHEFNLLSSYTVPRMEERIEREDRQQAAQSGDLPSWTGSSGGDALQGGGGRRLEMYEVWDMESVTCGNERRLLLRGEGDERGPPGSSQGREKTTTKKKKIKPTPLIPLTNKPLPVPPVLIVSSPFDTVYVSTRDADDAVQHARSRGDRRLALLRGYVNRRELRGVTLEQLVQEYLVGLVRTNTLEGLQVAARSCPALLMGNVDLWERWTCVFAKLPAGLFALREFVPVRDPKLASSFYEMMLEKMLMDVETMYEQETRSDLDTSDGNDKKGSGGKSSRRHDLAADNSFPAQAKGLYLAALRAWGPTSGIRERMRLLRWPGIGLDGQPPREETVIVLRQLEHDLFQRLHQSASEQSKDSNVLRVLCSPDDLPSDSPPDIGSSAMALPTGRDWLKQRATTSDSLYSMARIASRLAPRMVLETDDGAGAEGGSAARTPAWRGNVAVATEAMAELNFMRGAYDEALRMYLVIGANQSRALDEDALRAANRFDHRTRKVYERFNPYQHVLAMIEQHHLYSCLTDESFIPTTVDAGGARSSQSPSPIVALLHLVGLELGGRFLMESCVPPESSSEILPAQSVRTKTDASRIDAQVPMHRVASQLAPRPKLLYWYLHSLFVHRPDVYVNFPNTAVPPKEVTDLHQQHLELLIKYSKDVSSKPDSGTGLISPEADSHLMKFMKATFLHGGIRPEYARKLLEERRRQIFEGQSAPDLDAKVASSPLFARELAYAIEKSGRRSEDDAKAVLGLYLEAAKSLQLAVQYAETNTEFSEALWERLVTHCLEADKKRRRRSGGKRGKKEGGPLFGTLLQAAALSGADLAHLVTQIPRGMRIRGLQPMLVAAVADYRLRVKMHEESSAVCARDKVALLRELGHRSRRATRVQFSIGNLPIEPSSERNAISSENVDDLSVAASCVERKFDSRSRTLAQRQFRQRHAKAMPLR